MSASAIKIYDHDHPSVGLPFLYYLFDVKIDGWSYGDTGATGKMLSDFSTISNATYYEIPKGSYVHFSLKSNKEIKIKYASEADVDQYEKEQEETDCDDDGWWTQAFVKKIRVKVDLSVSTV